jgi:hypothetical protein
VQRNRDVIDAKIEAEVARLRVLAAWTAVAIFNQGEPPPSPLQKKETRRDAGEVN